MIEIRFTSNWWALKVDSLFVEIDEFSVTEAHGHKNGHMEDLMTGSDDIKTARMTALFRRTHDVYDCTKEESSDWIPEVAKRWLK